MPEDGVTDAAGGGVEDVRPGLLPEVATAASELRRVVAAAREGDLLQPLLLLRQLLACALLLPVVAELTQEGLGQSLLRLLHLLDDQ